MITTAWFFGNEDLSDAHAIRRKVFIEEQGIDESLEIDGTDTACMHLVAYEEGTPAATGRILITRDDFIIGRVAVLPAYRHRHFGTLVMQVLINACFTMGGERQVVHAQLTAKPFYERLGFAAYGEEYMEAGLPHIAMAHTGDCEKLCQGKCH